MTPPDDDPPQPPKRRRKPPKGFDTGYPEDAASDVESGGIHSKPIWTEPVATTPPPTVVVDPELAAPRAKSPTVPPHTPIAAPRDTRRDTPIGAPRDTRLDTPRDSTRDTPIGAPLDTRLDTPIGALPKFDAPLDTPPAASRVDTPPAASRVDTAARVDTPLDTPIDTPLDTPIDTPIGAPIEAAPYAAPATDTGRVAAAELDTAPHAYERAPSQAYDPLPATPPAQSAPFQGFEPMPAQADLDEAIGKKKKKKNEVVTLDYDDFDDAPRRSRKTIVVSVLSLVVGLGIAGLVFLGRQNSSWFYISCEPDKIVAQQGRAFPPWGETALGGKAWSAVKIPPDAECIPLETEDEEELATAFRSMLVKRASALLTAKEVTKIDEANALLDQALLHARSNSDAAKNARTDIQRLLGDVAYWRASLKMREASKTLAEAAKQFEAAAQQRPRHVTDASAWADYVRKVVGELDAGPNGAAPIFPPMPAAPTAEPRTPAPPGVALPVEPDQGSASEAPPPTPDAGVQGGGVLL